MGLEQLFSHEKRDFLNRIFLENKKGILASIPRVEVKDPPNYSPERQGTAELGVSATSSVEAEAETEGGASLLARWNSGHLEPGHAFCAPQNACTRCRGGHRTLNSRISPEGKGLNEVWEPDSEPRGVQRGECNETSPEDRLSGKCSISETSPGDRLSGKSNASKDGGDICYALGSDLHCLCSCFLLSGI